MKKTHLLVASASVAALLGLTAQLTPVSPLLNGQEQVIHAQAKAAIPSPREDFFEAANKEYLDSKKMPDDEISVGVNDDLDKQVEDRLKTILADLDSGKTTPKDKEQQQLLNYYRLSKDFARRESDGTKPVQETLKKITSLKDRDDLVQQLSDWITNDLPLPFSIGTSEGLKDPKHNELEIADSGLILPDTSYYKKGNKDADKLLKVYHDSSINILKAMGYDEKEAKDFVEKAIQYDKFLATYRTPSEKRLKYSDNFFPISEKEAHDLTDSFDLLKAVESIIGQEAKKINVNDKLYAKGLKEMMDQDHFDQLKSWMLVREARHAAPYLTDSLRLEVAKYRMAQSGAAKAPDKEKASFRDTTNTFPDVLGNDYAQTYFGPEARKEVEGIIKDLINQYKERLAHNDWLGKETAKKAIEKLDKMKVMAGYPDNYNKNTPLYTIDPAKSLYENVRGMNKVDAVESLKDYGKPVAENQWSMAPFEVNAYYSSTGNLICIPAGILQAPFYDKQQSASQNYGGIGAAVGHELSHAFDPSGAEFDADGVYKNWWTKADYKAFNARTKKIVAQFDGVKIHGGKLDGKQTLGENVADNGGLVVAIEALKQKGDPNFDEFFRSYARSWAVRYRPEFAKMALATDEHAPAELRTNIAIQNFDEFYKTYGVKKGDKMYKDPKDRILFW